MIDFDKCPERYRNTLKFYFENHLPPGSCMQAILSMDLFETVGRADETMMADLRPIVTFLNCTLPSNCWGNRQKVNDWLKGQTS